MKDFSKAIPYCLDGLISKSYAKPLGAAAVLSTIRLSSAIKQKRMGNILWNNYLTIIIDN